MTKLSAKTAITNAEVEANKGTLLVHAVIPGAPNLSKKATDNQVMTQRFADSAARALAVPGFIGQLGVQVDTGVIYTSNGISAGDWTASTWQTFAYNGANFTAPGGTWTVDNADEFIKYKYIDKNTVILIVSVAASTIATTPSSLIISNLPFTIVTTATDIPLSIGLYNDAVSSYSISIVPSSSTSLEITKVDGTAFTDGTDDQAIYFQFICEIA